MTVAALTGPALAAPAWAATDSPSDPAYSFYLQALKAQMPYYGYGDQSVIAAPAAEPVNNAWTRSGTASGQPAGYSEATPQTSTSEVSPVTVHGAPLWGSISEIRFGILSHDVRFPSRHQLHAPNPFDHRYEEGININPEVVFVSPDIFDSIWSPRPHVGISVNMNSDTSSIYTGLGWDTSWENGIFIEGFFGLAAHNGELTDGNPDKVEFGSTALFRLGGDVGWRWDEIHGVSLVWEHMSNAGVIDEKNQGIDSLGIRYSYRFVN